MIKNYESPELEVVLLDYDVLTSSDNDAPFPGSEDGDLSNWGQYY